MPCKHCQEIRTAILHGRMAEAAGLTVEKLRESIGWKAPEATDPEADSTAPTGKVAAVGEQAPEIIIPEKSKKTD